MTPPARVLIADKISSAAQEILAASPSIEVDAKIGISAEDLCATIGDYDGLLIRSRTKVTRAVIEAATKLKLIGRAGIGVDNIDRDAATRHGILVENAPNGNAVTTAEHALCLLLSLARHIPQASASMKQGLWEKNLFSGTELCGKTLGVIGLGNIGRIVADRARGLKLEVVAYDPYLSGEMAERLGVELLPLDTLLQRADFLTLHTPMTDETRGLLDATRIAHARPGVLIVNAARGGLIDEDAMIAALDSGHVGGLALDVYTTEPPPKDNRLIAHPRVICTPHLGASTEEAQIKVAVEIANNVVAFFERQEIRNAINLPRISADQQVVLEPWLGLAEKVGTTLAQISQPEPGALFDGITIETQGVPSDNISAITSAVLAGVMGRFIDGPSNRINAPLLARERGLDVAESVANESEHRGSSITVRSRSKHGEHRVEGTLYRLGDDDLPRIVGIDGFRVELVPSGTILAIETADRPGVVGRVGTVLGAHAVAVTELHVGQDKRGGKALSLWTLDTSISTEILAEIRSLEHVSSADLVEL